MGGCEVTHCFFTLVSVISKLFCNIAKDYSDFMENIGDYIYFILLAVFALSGLLGKKKKDVKVPEKKKSIFDQLPKSWEEFEEMVGKPLQEAVPSETTVLDRPVLIPASKPDVKTSRQIIPADSSEEIWSPEYEPSRFETMSYEMSTDFSKLRAKKQIKESIFKKKSSLWESDPEPENEADFRHTDINLDSTEEAKKAFIYSEIFQRKYS